jgi:hypothetical protein
MHWIDPDQLPQLKGIIERFTMNGQGDLDGLVLDVGASAMELVHFPSHMSDDVDAALKPGDTVAVRGVRPRHAEVVAAVSLLCADGREILDRGPPKRARDKKCLPEQVAMSASGQVRLTLFTPKGKVRGALLDDGTIIRLKLKEAEEIRPRLQPGATIDVWGMGLETRHGRVIEVHRVIARPRTIEVVIKPKKVSPAAIVAAGSLRTPK